MDHWVPNSQLFKEYIQQQQHQLSTFSQGMSAAVSWVPRFTNTERTGQLRKSMPHYGALVNGFTCTRRGGVEQVSSDINLRVFVDFR
mmetsp:Transcript_16345/g.26466  ORF Transcript_16345/g.26466 Transcript_16345/m.26466 type:complete len:87 (+) Transcript_16345:1206-1466(+)